MANLFTKKLPTYIKKLILLYMKKCNKCYKDKKYSEFYKCRTSKDGYKGKCKECTYNTYYDKEKRKLYNKRFYENLSPEKLEKRKQQAKEHFHSLKDGKYHVYLLPEEHYCGQTINFTHRLLAHKNVKNRIIEGAEIVMSFNTRKEALQYEACFHELGWYGKQND